MNTHEQDHEQDELEYCSACCGADIVHEDICAECKEHCEAFTEEEAWNVWFDSGFSNGLSGEA